MKVDIFTLCDSAQEYNNGKLVIVGTFNSIYAKNFPADYPEFALVARIMFSETEKGVHNIKFSIKKENEDVFILPVGEMTADNTDSKGKETTVNIVVKGNNIPIASPGIYIVTLDVDGIVWKSDLNVYQID